MKQIDCLLIFCQNEIYYCYLQMSFAVVKPHTTL
jgi:hypothetical protein